MDIISVLSSVMSTLSNGVIDCTSNEVGGTCTLTCDDDYELTGSASRTCQDNGTWSGTEKSVLQVGCMHVDSNQTYTVYIRYGTTRALLEVTLFCCFNCTDVSMQQTHFCDQIYI